MKHTILKKNDDSNNERGNEMKASEHQMRNSLEVINDMIERRTKRYNELNEALDKEWNPVLSRERLATFREMNDLFTIADHLRYDLIQIAIANLRNSNNKIEDSIRGNK